ncbi:MAG: class II aldolase/adducin family protein [Jatrophihabitans sp.]
MSDNDIAAGDIAGLVDEMLAAARQLGIRSVLSASGHGNISIRRSGTEEMLYTAVSNLRELTPAGIARIGLDGTLLAGTLSPLSAGGARMHAAVYQARPDLGCVVHTHSPFATAYAVAGRPIGCWAEPLSIFGMAAGIPVVPYGFRGSPAALEPLRRAVAQPDVRAVLLQNHGVLAFAGTAADAVHVSTLVEEAAQLGIYASSLGGPLLLPDSPPDNPSVTGHAIDAALEGGA